MLPQARLHRSVCPVADPVEILLGAAAVALCLTLLAGGRPWAALLPLAYLAAHTATWRKMVRIDHGEELNVCLGETARNILLFGALFTAGILLG